jgi:mannose-1-phosphate guanylyltransferase
VASPNGYCVIMAGGKGTRFWPVSRRRRPKQLLALSSGKTLLRDTFERVLPLVEARRILVITNDEILPAVRQELPELPVENAVAEPVGRNTAPCAALGAGLASRLGGNGPVAFLPADHWIPDDAIFREQLQAAFRHATQTGQPITFGITPTCPETGYGYVEVAAEAVSPSVKAAPESVAMVGRRFIEKPDFATAERYLARGHYLWNSGIFVWDSDVFAQALATHLPRVSAFVDKAVAAFGTSGFSAALAEAYAACPSVSIDVGIMEKLSDFAVFQAAFRWSDIGSWNVWGDLAPELADQNRGRATLYQLDSRGNVVYAPERAIALIGVEDFIIVDTEDALLICRKQQAQRIRDLTAQLQERRRDDLL